MGEYIDAGEMAEIVEDIVALNDLVARHGVSIELIKAYLDYRIAAANGPASLKMLRRRHVVAGER